MSIPEALDPSTIPLWRRPELWFLAAVGGLVGGFLYPELGFIGGPMVGAAAMLAHESIQKGDLSRKPLRAFVLPMAGLGLVLGLTFCVLFAGPADGPWVFVAGPLVVAGGFGGIGLAIGGIVRLVWWAGRRWRWVEAGQPFGSENQP